MNRGTGIRHGRRWGVRLAGVVAATTALALGMAGCSSSGSASSNITAWGVTGDKPYISPSVADWNKAKGHADSPIKADYFGTNDYKDKIRTAVSSTQAPTLIYTWGGGTLDSYVKAGLVKDLTPDLKNDKTFTDKLVPSVTSYGQYKGKTYALPMSSTAPVLFYYNNSVLKKVGISQPKTWAELMADVPKIRKAGYQPIAIGGQSQWPYLMWVEYLVDRIGGPKVFQNILDNKPNAWSDPAVTKATGMIQDLIKAGGFADGFQTVSADTNADLAQVVTGRAAMMLQGSWSYSGIKGIDPTFESSGKLGYGPFPEVSGGKGNPLDIAGNPSSYWAVSAKASDAQAKTAVDYLTKSLWNDQYTETVIKSGNLPPLKGVSGQLDGDFSKYLNTMVEKAPNFVQSWDLALSPTASTKFWTELSLLFNQSITPEQFSQAMNTTISK
jgi:raffinose/stachyose/melibiose transport system substrate-binding protein